MAEVRVRPLGLNDAEQCDAIMRTLNDWFSHEGGLADCANAVRTQPGRVADLDGQVIGFATWTQRNAYTAEVTWMGVHREYRDLSVGTQIIEAVCDDLRARGYRLALAMTSGQHKVALPGPDPYDATRAFWLARGFLPLIELNIWDTDMALLMVRSLLAPYVTAVIPPPPVQPRPHPG